MKTIESFIVGEVFQYGKESLLPEYIKGDFKDFKNWLWEPAQKKVISVNVFSKMYLKEYVLQKNMNSSAIKNANNSTPMEEDQFWAMLYLLIINPKLGKEILKYELRKDKHYIFHLKLTSGDVIVVYASYFDYEWGLSAKHFYDGDDLYCESNIFLFPTIIEK